VPKLGIKRVTIGVKRTFLNFRPACKLLTNNDLDPPTSLQTDPNRRPPEAEVRGQRFESSRARHKYQGLAWKRRSFFISCVQIVSMVCPRFSGHFLQSWNFGRCPEAENSENGHKNCQKNEPSCASV